MPLTPAPGPNVVCFDPSQTCQAMITFTSSLMHGTIASDYSSVLKTCLRYLYANGEDRAMRLNALIFACPSLFGLRYLISIPQ